MVASVSVSVSVDQVPVSDPVTPRGEWLASVLHRLAEKAHAEGLVILNDGFAPIACRVTSSQPDEAPYLVILTPGYAHGCDCKGYGEYGYCKHYALCLEVAGWLPDPPDEPPPAPIAALPPADRRALAAADLAARYPSQHSARAEDAAVAA